MTGDDVGRGISHLGRERVPHTPQALGERCVGTTNTNGGALLTDTDDYAFGFHAVLRQMVDQGLKHPVGSATLGSGEGTFAYVEGVQGQGFGMG